MRWDELDLGWQAAFDGAWYAFCAHCRPVGAAVTDGRGDVLTHSRTRVFEEEGECGELFGTRLAHAELNALLMLDENEHLERGEYTLYTTCEPCPMCIGALAMSGVKQLKFAASDSWSGSSELNDASLYMRRRGVQVEGAFELLEEVSVCWLAYAERERSSQSVLIDVYLEDYPRACALALELFEEGDTLREMAREEYTPQAAFDYTMQRLEDMEY